MRRPRSLIVGSALGLLLVGMAMVGGSAGAQIAPLACGSTITANTTLTADVGPCNTGNGLIVRGSNFVLNLNGHRVFSDAPLPRNSGVDADGIWVPADVVGIKLVDATNVTVTNGTVERFNAGVSIEGGSANTVVNVTSQNNQGPCIGEDFSTFATGQYGDGIVVFGSPNNRLLNNTIRNNGPFSGVALVANDVFITRAVAPYPSGSTVSGNTIEDNNICFADIGIRVEGPGATGTRVTNNTVRRNFQEGIVVHPVNVIDFRPIFQNPPACQNRGFPSPTLPQCPIQNPLNPTNDGAMITGNTVEANGFGGRQINAGPNAANAPSNETASGINLLAFCGYGANSNTNGSIVQGNTVRGNAGDGILAGGCPLGQNPAAGTFPGVTNSRIVQNTSVNNNARGCGVLPAAVGCGSRPTVARADLHDSTNEMTCPSTNAAAQAVCAGLGFTAPPASGPFVGTRVTQPGGTACDNNIWYGNRYGTAFPACTTLGGTQIGSVAAAPAATATGGRNTAQADDSGAPARGADEPAARPYPLRSRAQ
jgi:hypothetical protein